ncbi:unnamed protein product [Arctogadus glacialis]
MGLKSWRPFAIHAHELLRKIPADTCKAAWVKATWREQWRIEGLSRDIRQKKKQTSRWWIHLLVEPQTWFFFASRPVAGLRFSPAP